MIAATYCSMVGMLSIGNIIPESITIGMSNTIADMSNATSCVFATFEMSNPNVEFIGKKPGDPEDLPFAAEEAIEG